MSRASIGKIVMSPRHLLAFSLLTGSLFLWALQLTIQLNDIERIGIARLAAADDFAHYYFAAKRLVSGRAVYCRELSSVEVDESVKITRASNPPPLVLLTAPLALLDQRSAWAIWNIVIMSSYGAAAALMCRTIHLGGRRALYFMIGSLVYGPLISSLRYSQVQPFLCAILIGGLALNRGGRVASSGIVIGGMLALKLLPLPLVTFFVAKNRARFALTAALSFVVLNALPQLWRELSFYDYASCGVPIVKLWAKSSTFNQSASGLLQNLTAVVLGQGERGPLLNAVDVGAVGLFGVLAFALAGVLGYRSRSVSVDAADRYLGLALFISVAAAPIAWPHYYVLALPALAILLKGLGTEDMMLFCALWLAFPFEPVNLIEDPAQRAFAVRLGYEILTFGPGLLATGLFSYLGFRVMAKGDRRPAGAVLGYQELKLG